jgi:hypothetical protein
LNGVAHPEIGANRASPPHPVVKQTTHRILRRRPGRSHRDPLLSSVIGTQRRNLSSGRLSIWLIARSYYLRAQEEAGAHIDRPKLSPSRADVKSDSSTAW